MEAMMSFQHSFDFGSVRPAGPPRQPDPLGPKNNLLMVLAKPGEKDANSAARTSDQHLMDLGFGGKLVPPHLLHFTLHPIGQYSVVPWLTVDALGRCLDAIKMRPFTVSLNTLKNFHRKDGPPLIVLGGDDGVVGLRMAHKEVTTALTRTFGPVPRRPFEPHMTVSYRAMEIPQTSIEPITFVIREFVLVNSIIGQARHEVLTSWQLRD